MSVSGFSEVTEEVGETKSQSKEQIGDMVNTEAQESGDIAVNEQIEQAESIEVDIGEVRETPPESLPALEELINGAVNVGNKNASWNYTHFDDGSGTLRLTKASNFTLQNKVNGVGADTSLLVHIIVAAEANSSNITMHNMNITRPSTDK